MPKLKGIQFETAIIERYKRRECSVEEALIEMYLAGVSVRRVEDITETLWGTKVSSVFSVKRISSFSSSEFPIVIVGKSPLSAGPVRKQVPLLHPAA